MVFQSYSNLVNTKFLVVIDEDGNILGCGNERRYYQCQNCQNQYDSVESLPELEHSDDISDIIFEEVEKLLVSENCNYIKNLINSNQNCNLVIEHIISCPQCKDKIKLKCRIDEINIKFDDNTQQVEIESCPIEVTDPWDILGFEFTDGTKITKKGIILEKVYAA